MKCPACGAEGEGRFCGFCGVSLEARSCPACGNSVPTVHRFCSECGAPQGEGPGRPSSGGSKDPGSVSVIPGAPPAGEAPPVSSGAAAPPASTSAVGSGDASFETGSVAADGSAFGDDPSRAAPSPVPPDRRKWWISGAALLGAIVFLTLPYVWTSWADGGNGERMPMGAQRALPSPGPAPGVDLSSMTPREAADRLFNRVMGALSSGDQEEVDSFLPMAIDAYRLVPDLDADGHFHLSLLHQAGGDYQAGLETAERVLATEPDHLLALYAAGESARAMGDAERADNHFRRVLEVFGAESARDLPEYREHASLLPAIRESAEEFVGR